MGIEKKGKTQKIGKYEDLISRLESLIIDNL